MVTALALLAWHVGTGQGIISLAAVLTALAVIVKAPPVRWLFRTLVGDPISREFRAMVSEVVDERLSARPLTNGWGASAVKAIAEAVDADVGEPGRSDGKPDDAPS